MDGFKLNHNVIEALKTSAVIKIRAVTEEGGTRHVNQMYDQCRAVEDKNVSSQMIDWARGKVSGNISQ